MGRLFRKTNTYDKHKLTLTIETALEEFSDVVYRVAYSFAKHEADAQDIFQEVFMRFMKYGIGKEYDSFEHAEHWFVRVTINCYHTFVSKVKRREEVETDPRNVKEGKRDYSTLTEAIGELDEKYRIVVHLFYYEDYKVREIADILEENENTIKTRLARAKKMLREKLEDGY